MSSMNAPVMVELEGETDPLEVLDFLSYSECWQFLFMLLPYMFYPSVLAYIDFLNSYYWFFFLPQYYNVNFNIASPFGCVIFLALLSLAQIRDSIGFCLSLHTKFE